MPNTAHEVVQELKKLAHADKAAVYRSFFKTEKGEYGEGDVFLGIRVPDQRRIAQAFFESASLDDIGELLRSPVHEHRFTALEMLVMRYEYGNKAEKKKIFGFYLKNAKLVNNWDLVDTSVEYIVGNYLLEKSPVPLTKLARSKNVWERRMAIVATFAHIKKNRLNETLRI